VRLPRLRITKGPLPRSVRICRPEVLDLRIRNASVPSGSANVRPFLLVATRIVAGHVEREPSLAAQHFRIVPNIEFISGYTNRLLKHVDSVKMDSQRFESADPSRHGAFE
jgi:hypothetical protein